MWSFIFFLVLCSEYCKSTPIPNLQYAMYPSSFNFIQPRILPQEQTQYPDTESMVNAKRPISEQMPLAGVGQHMNNELRAAMAKLSGEQRQIIGTIISAIPFLPIQINVPDAIAAFVSGVQGFIGNIGQRIPILNNWSGQAQPAGNGMMAMSMAQTRVGLNGEQTQPPLIIFVPLMMHQSRSLEVVPNDNDDAAVSA